MVFLYRNSKQYFCEMRTRETVKSHKKWSQIDFLNEIELCSLDLTTSASEAAS